MPSKPALRAINALAVAVCALTFAAPATAQDYPAKPVRLIVGFPPGGATDLVARIMAPNYSQSFKQQVIVDNRAGANGTIGTDIAAKSAPDGYTMHLATMGSLVISPAITKVPYDPLKDLVPVSQAVSLQNIFITHPTLPTRTIKDLIALAKSHPGKLNYASPGVGSPGNLAGELFNNMAGVKIVHVPYKGGGPALTDLIAGHIEIFVAVISTIISPVKSGRARALAVTGNKRVAVLPDVPTVAESGLKGYETTNWFGIVVPAGTPAAIIERLQKETVAVLNQQEVRDALLASGIDAVSSTPQQFAAYIRSETEKWIKVIKAANLKAE